MSISFKKLGNSAINIEPVFTFITGHITIGLMVIILGCLASTIKGKTYSSYRFRGRLDR